MIPSQIIDTDLITRILNDSNNMLGISNLIGNGDGNGLSIHSNIQDLQTFTGITNPLPEKSLQQQIDGIRIITGYTDSSVLYFLLPPNPDGTIPSIQENHNDYNALIHLECKGGSCNENFGDYFYLIYDAAF